jgi:TolB-like protein
MKSKQKIYANLYITRYLSIPLVILLISLTFNSYGEDNLPRIVVIPLNTINVSETDAESATEFFETSLLNTGTYSVIEQTNMIEILKGQGVTLSGCATEECAIEIGQLLNVEQVVLGTLASIGGKYILTVKFIDVRKGVSLKAEKLEGSSLIEMRDSVERLIGEVAKLTRPVEEPRATEGGFGEIYVQTEPPGAEIYLNGVHEGGSPLLIRKVPLGVARIEGRKGNLYGMAEVRITRSGASLSLQLSQQIEATSRATGTLNYNLPSGVSAQITGEKFEQVITAKGTMTLLVGTYGVQTESDVYEPYSTEIVVKLGEVAKFEPDLSHTKEYEHDQFNQLLDEWENQTSPIADIQQTDIDRLVHIREKIRSARHSHPELFARSETLLAEAKGKISQQGTRTQLRALQQRQDEIENRLHRMEPSRNVRNVGKWISLGTGVVGFGASAVFLFLADSAYEKYMDATITSDVIHYRDQVSAFKIGMYVGVGVGGAGLGSSLALWFLHFRERRYKTELDEVEARIQKLQIQLE